MFFGNRSKGLKGGKRGGAVGVVDLMSLPSYR